jgi:hypothetical protein
MEREDWVVMFRCLKRESWPSQGKKRVQLTFAADVPFLAGKKKREVH